MKISKKADYALHAMLYVSNMSEKQWSTINEIAREELIPREYLAKVLNDLVNKGLLKSVKGIFGGYKLAKPSNRISFLNIIEAMDGPLQLISCANDRHSANLKSKKKYCAGQVFWIPMQDKIKDSLGHMTLDKLLS